MNCLVLLLLVLCCGNQSGCGGGGTSRFSENGGWLGGNGYGNNNDYGFNTANNNQCGCSGDGIETRNNGIREDNCRSDVRNFIPYPTSNGGFDERQNSNDCDCNQ